MRTHRAALALVIAPLLVLLAACAGDDDTAPSGRSDPTTAGEPASTPAPADSAADAPNGLASEPEPSTSDAVPGSTATGRTHDAELVVVLDPGHGGDEVGAAAHGVVEKESNLDMALRVEALLQAEGVRVVLTRREDRRVMSREGIGTGFPATRLDLQARVDLANAEGADLFVSLHSNGSPDPGQSGVEVWFNPQRPFADTNRALAESVLGNVMSELSAYGYPAVNRGIKDDSCFRMRFDRCFTLFLLGPPRTTTRDELQRRGVRPEVLGMAPDQDSITTRATEMPGVLVELLFVSNASDAAMLRDEGGRDAMARGVARSLLDVLRRTGG